MDLGALTPAERDKFDIPIRMIIHLTSPYDNKHREFEYKDDYAYPLHDASILFEWEPVPAAVKYFLAVDAFRDLTHPDGYNLIERVFEKYLEETRLTVTLYPSKPKEKPPQHHSSF